MQKHIAGAESIECEKVVRVYKKRNGIMQVDFNRLSVWKRSDMTVSIQQISMMKKGADR
jgi:hypothetical protein